MGSGPPSPDAYGTDRRRPHRHRQLLADRRLNGTDPWDRRFLADRERTNMENFGVPPDIFVENTPETTSPVEIESSRWPFRGC
jgi:hypothetical protein